MKRYSSISGMISLLILLLLAGGCAIGLKCPLCGKDEKIALFNGKNLDGWTQKNGKAKYEVQDGAIVGTTVQGQPNSFLCTEKMYTDFILELDFKVHPKMNSGIQIRSNSLKDYNNYRVHGYQVEIDPDMERARCWTGGIYDEARSGWLYNLEGDERKPAREAFKPEKWNHFKIICQGNSIKTWLNGVPAADLTDDQTAKGFIALQVHQTNEKKPMQIRWRNIYLTDLAVKEPLDYEGVATYEYGQSRLVLTSIEEGIRDASPAERKDIEKALLEVLKNSKATFAGKQFVCRMLARIGSDKSVPTLSKMLPNDEYSNMARFALQEMPSKKVDTALLKALPKAKAGTAVGLINSIGERGSTKAIPQLAKLLNTNSPAVAAAAISALGKIGTPKVADLLTKAKVSTENTPLRIDALLRCADKSLANGDTASALAIYQDLRAENYPTNVRIAAYRGSVRCQKNDSVPMLIGLLRGKDAALQGAAGKLVAELPKDTPTRSFATHLADLPASGQVVLLGALSRRGDKSARKQVTDAAGPSSPPEVRLAALNALATLGDATSVPTLAQATRNGGEQGEAAVTSLSRLTGKGVDSAIIKAMANKDSAICVALIESLVARRSTLAVPTLTNLAKNKDAKIRHEALGGLSVLADEKALPSMIALLAKAKDSADLKDAEKAVKTIGKRTEKDLMVTKELLKALSSAKTTANRTALIRTLGPFGSQAAMPEVSKALASKDEAICDAAIRSFSEWPTDAPAQNLLGFAKSTKSEKFHVLAIRAYSDLITRSEKPAAEKKKLLQNGVDAARRDAEKKTIENAIKKIK